ncbi:STAS domain-containing protein [Streptomyces sp. NBC_01754]|uniref:STAS domain-containing protein n=1 Tax=Streptomyces sp. NBC_01754 TaxID=2975930 RepID=UPI002DD93A73|nr:STAS domain-containing protein [Streptomyces sp. NBC_01754]WSC91451.1 STAS domain-containing protein [Streptomyces sp. NBC_01754]
MTPPLRVEVVAGVVPALVRVHGELDVHTGVMVSRALEPLVTGRVEMDLGPLRFMDGSGLHALVVAERAFRCAGGSLRVIDFGQAAARVVDIIGCRAIFTG